MQKPIPTCLLVLFAGLGSATPFGAQEPASEETIQFFKTNCASCHTIGGGRLTGPDLKGALDRQDRDWMINFILDPPAVIASGDPYALQILSESRGVPMSKVPGLDRARAGKLVDLIASESAAENSRFAGVKLSDRPLTAMDTRRGEEFFRGTLALKEGGAACVSCHTAGGVGGLGGGQLGPDLTAAFARLEGRRGLGAWLAAPPSAVMQPLYSAKPLDPEEILALIAYLRDSATGEDTGQESEGMTFLLAGIGLAAIFMVALDVLWRRRFRAIRRPLVARS